VTVDVAITTLPAKIRKGSAPSGGDGTGWPRRTTTCSWPSTTSPLRSGLRRDLQARSRHWRSDTLVSLTHKTAIYGGFAGRNELEPAQSGGQCDHSQWRLGRQRRAELLEQRENSYGWSPAVAATHLLFLDGLVIRGGNANGSIGSGLDNGGGMHNFAGSSPMVSNCVFTSNSANSWAGRCYNAAWGASPTVVNCTFDGNLLNGSNGAGPSPTGMAAGRDSLTVCSRELRQLRGAIQSSGDCATLLNCAFVGIRRGPPRRCGEQLLQQRQVHRLPLSRQHGKDVRRCGWHFRRRPTLINCAFSGNIAQGAGGARSTTPTRAI